MMSKTELMQEFHDEVAATTTAQLHALHDLSHDGSFAREAGVEFVLAVETVCDERGISE